MDEDGGEQGVIQLGGGDKWRKQIAQGSGIHIQQNRRSTG
jgi:hypothetical protein